KLRIAEAECELLLGKLDLSGGDIAAATERFPRAMAICQTSADRHGEANAHWCQGKLARVRAMPPRRTRSSRPRWAPFGRSRCGWNCCCACAIWRSLARPAGRLARGGVACGHRLRRARAHARYALGTRRAALAGSTGCIEGGRGDAAAFEAVWAEGREADLYSAVAQAIKPLPDSAAVSSVVGPG
ncbi:MAG: hypothetical protein U5L74_07190, partial [Ideonella sp.]|nr:hypothetical protein [Ideonella sp.]